MKFLNSVRIAIFLIIGVISGFLTSCNSNSDQTARVIVTLIDSPGDYDAVNIDIIGLEVHANQGEQQNGWISLNTNTAVYDLLQLTNGNEALLADTELPTGKISQLRLVLGDNNTLVTEGNIHILTVPSGQESGLKLLINQTLEEGITYTFKLDFDAARSVVKAGTSGKFNLKPVIKVITEATSGAVRGSVLPKTENVAIYAMQGMDTIGTSYAIENIADFIISGLDAGIYDIVFDPGETSELNSFTVEGIEVIIGEVTQMDTIELQLK